MNVPTQSAGAASFCTNINLLVDNAHSNFSEIIIRPERKSGGYDVTLRLEGAMDCTVIPTSNSNSYYCTWKFPHRATRAYATFEMFERELKECIGHRAVFVRDQPVNHPDFYDSRIFQVDQANVTVSVKDKSALGRTFVFVWVRPR
jgi:hypothetical protein